MNSLSSISQPAFLRRSALTFAIPCFLLMLTADVRGQKSDVDIVGKTSVVTTQKTISGAPASASLMSARVGKDFHIVVMGLPDDKPVQLELEFAEFEKTARGERIFNVEVNDKAALQAFDIYDAAGGAHKKIVKKFTITPARGFLDFHFTGVIGDAAINRIVLTGDGVNKAIAPPNAPVSLGHKSEVAAEEDDMPANLLASFNAADGTIELDKTTESWNSGVALGGIGTGKFELLPNGQLANFTINNSWDLPVLRPRGTFLAIATKVASGRGTANLLQIRPSDPAGKDLFPAYPSMESGKFTGQFPFGSLELKDEKVPLSISVEGWSAVIPNNQADSSLPGGVINVTLKNTKNYPVAAAVVLSWEDISGRGGSLLPGDQHGFSASSTHNDAATSNVTGVSVNSGYTQSDRAATFTGDYFVGTPIKGAQVTRSLGWNPRTTSISWWKQFSSRLRLDKIPSTPGNVSPTQGGPLASAVCVSVNLAPKEARRIPFIVSWYTPKIVTLDSSTGSPSEEAPDYVDRFKSAADVASYIASNRARFRTETDEWVDMIKRATVPQWVKTHTLNSLFPLHSNTIFLKKNRFAMLESPADMKGMLGPVDLKLSSGDFMLTMFPDLEKTELNLYGRAQEESGRIPRYVGNIHGALAGFDTEMLGSDWYDPTAAWVLQVGRYWRETGDDATLTALKPAVIKARDFLVTELKGESPAQDSNVFSAGDHYPAAGAMSRINAIAAVRVAQDILKETSADIDSLLQSETTVNALSETTATFSALLAGEYGARIAGSRSLFGQDAVAGYLGKVHSSNYEPSKPAPLMETPAANGAEMSKISYPAPLQSYVGALGLMAGEPGSGSEAYLRMFQIAYGAQKAPWKQALRYSVPSAGKASVRYHRSAMAAWSIWRGMSGVVYDSPNQRLFIRPQPLTTGTADMEIPVFTPRFWGWLKYNAQDSTGTLSITRVIGETTPTISSIATDLDVAGEPSHVVTFATPHTLNEGSTLRFDGWPGKAGGTIIPEEPVEPEPMVIGISDENSSATDAMDDDNPTTAARKSESSPETADGVEMTTGTDE